MMNDLQGQRLEQYRIDALLGEGGMGAVYRANDMHLQRTVALKVMHGSLARRPAFQQRFLQEAQAVARLDHVGIVKVFDFGRRSDLVYMVMEFVSGGSLGGYIRQLHAQGKVVQLQEVLYLLAQVAEALGYAHRQGVIHRDVKPDNILLKRLEAPDRPGEPPLRALVGDFGLAKLLDGGLQTATSTFLGTLPYMSPEQALNRPLDGRSDLYSLGVILYQLATGRLPFRISTPTEAVQKHQNEQPPAPRSIRPDLPEAIGVLIERAMAKSPANRFQSGAEMAAALRAAAARLSPDDVTRFAPVHTVLSLVTELRASAEWTHDPPTRLLPDSSMEVRGPELIVARQGMSPLRYPLEGPVLTLGRNPDSDIVLSGEGVSRRHVRVEQTTTGWRVVDLSSTNGTYLDDARLLPDVPEQWGAGQILRVGPFFVSWRDTSAVAPTRVAATRVAPLPPDTTRVRSRDGELGILVQPNRLTVAPGSEAGMQVELLNAGPEVAHYRLEIDGLPMSWASLPEEPAQLLPGDTADLSVSFHPPRDSSARNGAHPFRILVMRNGEQVTAVSGVLNITAYSQFASELQPARLRDGAVARLSIRNTGNAPVTFRITPRDPSGTLQLHLQEAAPELEPGANAVIPLSVTARQRALLGAQKTHPFDVVVQATEDYSQRLAGELIVPPRLPLVALPLLAFAGMLICLLGVLAVTAFLPEQPADAAGVNSQETVAAATLQALALLDGQATSVAATAAAATSAANGDDDGDGLGNQQETQIIGTDPGKADTDGDGLNDGEEVNLYHCDPLIPDTDADGLTDYEEIRVYDTNPLNPDSDNDGLSDSEEFDKNTNPNDNDTDGDGIIDGNDPEPLLAPTATPQPPAPQPPPPQAPPVVVAPDTPTPTSTPTHTPVPPDPEPDPPIVVVDPPLLTLSGQDCLGFEPTAAAVENVGGRWKITVGNVLLLDFDQSQAEAQQALDIIQFYGFNDQCFVGRPDPSLEYFLINEQAPTGTFPGEDCVSFNPDNLQLSQINGRWTLVDGSHLLMNFESMQAEGERALEIIQFYDFSQSCFVGRPDPSFRYLRR